MAKKSKKSSARQLSNTPVEKDVKVSKQAVGGVTGAVLGAMVAGPIGALAGGFAGAVVGEQSARGRKPMKKTVEAIRSEIRGAKPLDTLKSVTEKTKLLVSSRFKKKAKPKAKLEAQPASSTKKSKAGTAKKAAKKSKAKSATKSAKSKKHVKKQG